MDLKTLTDALGVRVITGSADAFEGVYAGDLLSRAMSHVESGNLWITIMNNVNVIAVASLSDAAAVLLAEDVALMPDALEAAEEKGVCILSSDKTVYELCAGIAGLM